MTEHEAQEWEQERARAAALRKAQREELAELAALMMSVESRLHALAVTEPQHGYASVGSAFDKMVRKAHVLRGDCWRMSRDVSRGSQQVAG